jgi:hypothetical protein
MKKDFSVSMAKANLYGLMILPVVVFLSMFYIGVWGFERLLDGMVTFEKMYLILILLMGAILHELIHGVSWSYFGKKPFHAIKFGFQLKALTPYAHCKEPLELRAYRIGALMPGFVLGILPSTIGIVTGDGWIMIFGLLFTLGSGGDLLILWLIRKVHAGEFVQDHPTRAGCYVIEATASESETPPET